MSDKSLKIEWNKKIKLIISDVDETIADLYKPAEPEMIGELKDLLGEGKSIFFVTGQGLKSVQWRIVDQIPQELRAKILVGHCSGAEVWGHNSDGMLKEKPFYSVYDLSEDQKKTWRELVKQIISEFNLKIFDPMPVKKFLDLAGNDPRSVMFEDRGPQITLEIVNGYDLTPEQMNELGFQNNDLRIPILEYAEKLFRDSDIPISPRLGGVFAVDFALRDVSKTTAVKRALEDESVIQSIGLTREDILNPENIEIWGDKFSVRGGTDRHMSEAVSPSVRSIDFREEDPSEFMEGYNIVVWKGKKHLHEGLLEFLQSRSK